MDKNSNSYILYKERINKALDFINNNLGEEIHLEDVAKSAFFSQFHFHRIFTGIMKETPDDYIRRLRLEKSAKLIRFRKDLSITSIAYICGFSSSALFSKNFKKYFNMTPLDWKNSKNRQIKSKNKKENKSEEYYNSDRIYKGELSVEVLKNEAFNVVYMKHLDGYGKGTEKIFKRLHAWASPRGLIVPETKFISMLLDSTSVTPKNKCRLYACISIDRQVEVTGDIGIMEIPEGFYAKTGFAGKHDSIDNFYKKFFQNWLPYSGYVPDDFPIYQVNYNLDNPEDSFEFDSYIKIKSL